WFEEWFDSPLYEKIYSNRNEEEANLLADLLTHLIPMNQYPNVLDLGCGRGRHSINLGKRGYTVTGIDLSEESITVARSKAMNEELRKVAFVVGDMRESYPETFDAVINLFTSFGYFENDKENQLVINNVSGMLRDKGVFVLDYLNAHKTRKDLVKQENGTLGKHEYKINRHIDNDDTIVKKISFKQKGYSKTYDFEERVKLYDSVWFEEKFSEEGFTMEHVFGDYTGAAFNKQSSPRLLMVAKK
ncbi:MAG: class I SAM-dependent methyltransferase, partial [Balneolales bacterium]